MSKNLSFDSSMKEDKNEEFLAFIKDYSKVMNKEATYNDNKDVVIFSLVILCMCETLMYYSIKETISKNMIMFGILFMYVSTLFKEIVNVINNVSNRKQRKKDVGFIKEKAQGWVDFYKQKENKLTLARSLISRLDNLDKIKFESINKEHIEKSIQVQKEDIYNFVNYEVSINDFENINHLLITMKNLENNTMALFKQEQDLKKIKNEVHAGIANNISNSFKDEKKKTSFN